MIQLLILILLCLLHCLTGFGILKLFRARFEATSSIALSLIIGIFVASVLPFVLQLLYIPLTVYTIFIFWGVIILLLNVPTFIAFRQQEFKFRFTIKAYEWPFLLIIFSLLLASMWNCYYIPQFSRDFISGPEAIAEFAVKEKTFINSVFSVDLVTTNNVFKSPYIHSLQLIYKLLGFPNGAMWLGMLNVGFILFLYQSLNKIVHPIITGILLLTILSARELHAYTYIVLYDYSNMIFFFLGYYFLVEYTAQWKRPSFLLAVLFLTAAVYIRSETFILVCMMLPLIAVLGYKHKMPKSRLVKNIFFISVATFAAYWVVIELYNGHYLPCHYQVHNLMIKNPFYLKPFFDRITEIASKLIFCEHGIALFGYTYIAFCGLLVLELILRRKLNRAASIWLYGILIIFIGLSLIGFLFPIMDVINSTKRGLFKLYPLILFYIANNYFVQKLSDKILKWEGAVTQGPLDTKQLTD